MTVLDSSSVCRTLIVVFCCVVAIVQSENIVVNNESFEIVQTQSGTIRGRESVTLFDGRIYYSFRGIPYARPPINELRFKVNYIVELFSNVLLQFFHCLLFLLELNKNCYNKNNFFF